MKRFFLIPVCLLTLWEGAGQAQDIAVSVRDPADSPVYSTVYFRRSSSNQWDRLGVTGPDGQLKATLACAPGMEIYADPFPGEYWNSPETACQQALPLRVAPRRRSLLSALLPVANGSPSGKVTREDVAYAVARAEAAQWRDYSVLGPRNALNVYLASSSRLPREQAGMIQTNLLNESSAFYSAVDRNRDGAVTRKEITAAISETRDSPY